MKYKTLNTEYGRGCGDIGCLPTEECVISTDSCSYSQRDGKDCGTYPTCKKKIGGSSTSSSSSSVHPSGDYLQRLFCFIFFFSYKQLFV